VDTLSAKTILLVEDEAIQAMMGKAALERYGYTVLTAFTGERAIELMAATPAIDLILMDIDLGEGIGGPETAARILTVWDIPVVFLSSHIEPEVVQKTETITCYGYVVKNSCVTVLDASIKMAFKLFDAKREIIRGAVLYQRQAESLALEVTRKNEMEESLRVSEMQYRRLFESAKDGILILDAGTGKILDVNPFLIEMLGYSKEQFIEKSIWEIGSFKDIVASKDTFLELQTNEYVRYENLPLETLGGEIRDVEFVSNVYLVSGQKVIQCNIRDIAKRRKSDTVLMKSENRFRSVFDTSTDAILITTPTGEFLAVNAAACLMFGRTESDILAIGRYGIFDLEPGRRNDLQSERNKTGLLLDVEMAGIRKGGERFPLELSSSLYTDSDGKVRASVRIQDISARKKIEGLLAASEIRYRRLFEVAKDGILILDAASGKILDVNPFLIDLLGYSKDQFVEKSIWEIGFFRDIVANKENFVELQQKEYLRYENLPLETADGRLINVEFISNKYSVGDLQAIQCFIRDMTERKIADDKIAALLADKELILKEVHHRIKNSMNTVKGLLSLQAGVLRDPAAVSALEDTGNRVRCMMMLYDKLYQTVSYHEMSVLQYLPSLIDEIVFNFPNAPSVTVEKHIDDVILDVQRLQPLGIILNELLTNIMKYAFTGRPGGVIVVSFDVNDPAGKKMARLTVDDNGNGIPESVGFESSTGFGLTLVKGLTRQLDGNIRIGRDRGTQITLEFALD